MGATTISVYLISELPSVNILLTIEHLSKETLLRGSINIWSHFLFDPPWFSLVVYSYCIIPRGGTVGVLTLRTIKSMEIAYLLGLYFRLI